MECFTSVTNAAGLQCVVNHLMFLFLAESDIAVAVYQTPWPGIIVHLYLMKFDEQSFHGQIDQMKSPKQTNSFCHILN